MQNLKNEWYDAVFKRRSRRQYNAKNLSDEDITHLHEFSKELNTKIDGVKIEIINQNPDEVFKGIIGSYGKIKGAPAYAAFIGNTNDNNLQEKIGYIGESFILEATSIGVATCWVGGFFRKDMVTKHVYINENEQVLAVTPLGYSPTDYSFEEKMMSMFATGHKRKNIEELCVGGYNDNWPEWVKSALELGRLAPSAVNRQPWRFHVENNSIKVSSESANDSYQISKRLDCGIAMIHIEVGVMKHGVRGTWKFLNHPDVAVFIIDYH